MGAITVGGLLFLLAAVALTVAVMSCAPRTAWAQSTTLTLAHLNPDDDLEVDFAAVIVSGGSASGNNQDLYSTGSWGSTGSIAAGDLIYGSSNDSFERIRTTTDPGEIRINVSSGADADGTFGGTGERAASSGWSFYLLTSPTGTRHNIGDMYRGNDSVIRLNPSGTAQTDFRAITSGQRFILALAKAKSPMITNVVESDATSSGARITVTWTNPVSQVLTIHMDVEQSGGREVQHFQATPSTSTTSHTFDVSGLDPSTQYTAYAGFSSAPSSDAGSARTTFTTNAPNRPPAFPSATATRQVQENAPAGEAVGAPVTATDPDGDDLTYTLTGSTDFEIVAGTGQIRVAPGASLDFENRATYTVTMIARDTSGATGDIVVTIAIEDVDEFTPVPGAQEAVSARHAYIGTVHLVVGFDGTRTYGYVANDYGGITQGSLPGVLFTDGRDRAVGRIAVQTLPAGVLQVSYADRESGLFKSGEGLRWLRVRLRAADNTVVGEAALWDSVACDNRSLCVGVVDSLLGNYEGQALGVDFFDAAAEVLESAPGGMENILFQAEDTGSSSTGVDGNAGMWIGGGFPGGWFEDGREKAVGKVVLHHGSSVRRLELAYPGDERTAQWKYGPEAYRKHRLVLRDRDGEAVLEWPMREALAAMGERDRHCGDTTPARRLCLDFHDEDLDPTAYRGQVMLLQVEDMTWIAMLQETPGGPVGGQLLLGLFGACMFGFTFRKQKSPQREWVILAAGAISSVLLPIFGYGDLFWGIAIVIIAVLAGGGWFFMTRSR